MRGIGSASENARTSVSTTPMAATIELRSPSGSPEAVAGAVACGRGRGIGAPVPGPSGGGGVGVGGARPPGGTEPTMALGWMLRSWFLLPAPSSWSVRMCQGAPETSPAPSAGPPAARFQYEDWAMWPPQARSTADPFVWKRTRTSAALLPEAEPEWTGFEIERIVPPQIVSRRMAPE